MIKLISARKYYGRHATGWVVLVRGCPHHCTGRHGKRDANSFIRDITRLFQSVGVTIEP